MTTDTSTRLASAMWPYPVARIVPHTKIRGGGERDRTDDPLLAKQVLSQLSYTPIAFAIHGGSGWIRTNDPRLIKTVL